MRCSTTAGNGKSCGSVPSQSHNDAIRSARFLTFASVLCGRLSQRRKIGYVGPRGKSRIDQTGMPMTAPKTASPLAMLSRNLLTLLIAVSLSATAAFAQGGRPQRQAQAPGEQQQQQAPGQSVLRLLPPDAVSEHSIETAWGKVDYTATAGTLSLFDQSGERAAAVFYTAYVAKGGDPAKRPITFVFNGGPGAASAYLNLGLVGPRIVDFGPGNRDAASVRLQDNPQTWLAFTDLVMIDPVGSGWSRAAKPDGANAFWGVRRDADAIAKTIALYLANNHRSASPKYLVGESYGGYRA